MCQEDMKDKTIAVSDNEELAVLNDLDNISLTFDSSIEYDVSVTVELAETDRHLFDSLIPTSAQAVDAAQQSKLAIVKFPEGIGWDDLLNRKGDDWEGWKQLGSLKKVDGKNRFQPMAAIKQRGLSPTAAANLALQGAAMIVGQAYMTEINNQLHKLEDGINAIQQELKRQHKARILGLYKTLMRYSESIDECSANPQKLQAALSEIEHVMSEIDVAWAYEIEAMRDAGLDVAKAKRMDADTIKSAIESLQKAEKNATTVFNLIAAAEKLSMQYDSNFSATRIAQVKARLNRALGDYAEARNSTFDTLSKQIEHMKGFYLSAPEPSEANEASNPVAQAAQGVARQVGRFTPLALIEGGHKKREHLKDSYLDITAAGGSVNAAANECQKYLINLDFMHNQANAIVIDGKTIKYIKMQNASEE